MKLCCMLDRTHVLILQEQMALALEWAAWYAPGTNTSTSINANIHFKSKNTNRYFQKQMVCLIVSCLMCSWYKYKYKYVFKKKYKIQLYIFKSKCLTPYSELFDVFLVLLLSLPCLLLRHLSSMSYHTRVFSQIYLCSLFA